MKNRLSIIALGSVTLLLPVLSMSGEIGMMTSKDEESHFDSTGKLIFTTTPQGDVEHRVPEAFATGTKTPTAAFCKRISESKEGVADMSRPCETLAEARAEAVAMIACKVAAEQGTGSVEYSSGVEYKNGYYYPITPIVGNGRETKLPSGRNVKETMHYHPNGAKRPSVQDIWSADVPGIVLVGDGKGGISPEMLRYDGNGMASLLTLKDDGSGFEESPSFLLSDLCDPSEKKSWERLLSDLRKQADRDGQNKVLSEKNPDNPAWLNGNTQACPDNSFVRSDSVRLQKTDQIGSVGGGYSSEIMDQVGTAFAEQGPCSAGILLESLKNQSK